MRGAAVVIAGLLGCATLNLQGPATSSAPAAAAAPAAPSASEARIRALAPTAAPAKKEIEVIGRGPVQMGGLKPQDDGTEFVVLHGTTFRCTKVPKSGRHPDGLANCRNLSRGDSRNPDIGRQHRAQTQGVVQ